MPDFKLNPNVPRAALKYAKSLLPFADWIRRYNRTWLIGDVIAGLTVGMLLVPQALAYAKLAGVPLEYGLYTGFFGAVFYTFFSTSKDVTIGPTAVLSQLCGQVLLSYNTGDNRIDPVVFLVCVAFVSGLMEVAIGLLNFGIIVDFIPVSVIVGFTTGAAISIITGQLAGLLGIPNINKSDATHIILYNTLKSIPLTKLDASIGISALICLMGFRIVTKHYLKRGYSWFSWVGYSSNVVVIIVFTFISFLINQGAKKPYFSVIGIVPKGLGVFKVPSLDHLPVILSASSTIVLVSILEHLAVAKSLGRLNGYTPDSNQEIIALGVTNTVGAFMGAYPSCGSFSRSSVLSRSGSRSPLVGFFIAGVVVMALYVVTPAFYFIPNSVLSAMIIAAITDLIARPKIIKEFWEIERTDFVTCLIALLVTIFVSIETAIFASVGFSAAVLLYRVARPQVQALQRDSRGGWAPLHELRHESDDSKFDAPPPGVFVFRIEESLSYPNAGYIAKQVRKLVEEYTARGSSTGSTASALWFTNPVSTLPTSDAIFGKGHSNNKPILRAIIFDFSAVNGIDATGLQILVDIRREVEKYAGRKVLFFFAHVHWQLQSVLHYFLANLDPNREVTPVTNATYSDPINQVEMKELEKERLECYGCESKFCALFIHRTIDQAIESADRQSQGGEFLDDNSTVTSPPAV